MDWISSQRALHQFLTGWDESRLADSSEPHTAAGGSFCVVKRVEVWRMNFQTPCPNLDGAVAVAVVSMS